MENKTELRIKIRERRKSLDIDKASKIIVNKIRKSDFYIKAQNIMLFYPMKYEINLLELLNDNKNFYFPRVKRESLLVCPNTEKFIKSDFNVLEPQSEPVNPDILDLIIVPALAVDNTNFRLGYGKGFYDRFLKQNSGITSVTPIFKEFVFKDLPKNNFDSPVNYIITDDLSV